MLQEEQRVFQNYCYMILLDEPFDKLVLSMQESLLSHYLPSVYLHTKYSYLVVEEHLDVQSVQPWLYMSF